MNLLTKKVKYLVRILKCGCFCKGLNQRIVIRSQ